MAAGCKGRVGVSVGLIPTARSDPAGRLGTMSMTAATTWQVRTPNGAIVAFCEETHMLRWKVATSAHRVPCTHTHELPAGRNPTCENCGWCGTLIPAAARCLHHWDGPCPTFDWTASICGQRCVTELVRMTGAPLPPTALVLIGDVAGELDLAGRFPSIDLHALAWAERDAWAV